MTVADVDTDGDGVLDCVDMCPGSIPDTSVLKFNRFHFDNFDHAYFSGGKANLKGSHDVEVSFSIIDTFGCTCNQIVDLCGYGQGFTKFGCSKGVMELFTDPSGPFCEGDEEPYPAFN